MTRWTQEQLDEYRAREYRAKKLIWPKDPPAPKANKAPKESSEQEAVAQWLTLRGVRFFYCPNGFAYTGDGSKESRGKFFWYLNQLKHKGLQKDVPDLHIITPPPKVLGACGAILEMKRQKGGKLSDGQLEWLDYYRTCGWVASAPKGADEAIRQLEIWGY